jgi:hypothetical protein
MPADGRWDLTRHLKGEIKGYGKSQVGSSNPSIYFLLGLPHMVFFNTF